MHSISVSKTARDLPDSEIAQRIAAGDRDALLLLMRRYNQTLYRTARSILKDDAEAEDAVQEAYLLAYRAMCQFRGDAKLSTWLVRIVINEALGRGRKRGRRAEVIRLDSTMEQNGEAMEVNMDETSPEQPERAALRAETRRLLEAKIDQLPDSFRTVFVLRAIEEMTVEEAAKCLGIPESTVRTCRQIAQPLQHAGDNAVATCAGKGKSVLETKVDFARQRLAQQALRPEVTRTPLHCDP
jgi:RNA polymerase sigma-70 factor, ECF subfamily